MKDSRVNPAAKFNYPIRRAAKNGHLEIVKLLMTDKRVNPSAEKDEVLFSPQIRTISSKIELNLDLQSLL